MPGWHELTEPYRVDGMLAVVGLVQEQHPRRTQLFMQWHDMQWPVMVDALNRLGVAVVPITLLIDEHGIIRDRPSGRGAKAALEAFIGQDYKPPPAMPTPVDPVRPQHASALRSLSSDGTPEALRAFAQVSFDWGGDDGINDAVAALTKAVQLEPSHAPTQFQRGVALRRRSESSATRQPGDFAAAVDAWSSAMELNPNQYIWRRRMQQYGPRLGKPYPFYDWVPTARAALLARNETPIELSIEPTGAEFARPMRSFEAESAPAAAPDPQRRITMDDLGIIKASIVVVPPNPKPGAIARVHVTLRPVVSTRGHWNNESEPLRIWIDTPDRCVIDQSLHTVANASTAVSGESRSIEFEIRVPAEGESGSITINGYALYNVCQDVDGTCLYRRLDFSTAIR